MRASKQVRGPWPVSIVALCVSGAARRRPQRTVVLLLPRTDRQGAPGRLRRPARRADAGLDSNYPTDGSRVEPVTADVLQEINGRGPDDELLTDYTQLRSDGSTACGCWIYCGVYAGGINQAARRKPAHEQDWVAAE